MFQCKLIGGSINLAKVIDAGIGRTGARSGAVWYCDCSKKPNDTNYNNYFQKTEIPT